MGGEEKTFKVNFTIDGIERLRNEVTEKLKEYMGDYTDDTLVEYVIVLLRNGRTKDEARNELNVFLGDEDSNAFVTWLWDHLSEKLNLYVQSDDVSRLNVEAKQKSLLRDPGISQGPKKPNHDLQEDRVDIISDNVDKSMQNPTSTYEAKTSNLRSVIAKTHPEEKNQHKSFRTRKSLSPRPSSRRKRNRVEERHHPERNTGLMAAINPTSRLLQSAVREAVGTAGLTDKATEPGTKRLRSVVATSNVDDSHRRPRSVALVSSIAGVALKAAAEAAEDVLRARPSGNVFDRLGRGVGVVERTTDLTDNGADEDHVFHDNLALQPQLYQLQGIKDSRRYAGELIDQEAELTDMDQDYVNDADDMSYRNSSLFQTSTSFQIDDDSTATQYGRATNSYRLKSKYQNQPEVHPPYDECVNVPANVNLRKPRQYLTSKEFAGPNSSMGIQGGDASDGKSDGQLQKKNTNGVVNIGNGKSAIVPKKGLHKTPSGATGSIANAVPQEDSDARTIFISNVHFAATKDNLSQHFVKFGQLLRVTILTDAPTGLPKGSAYVEFMQKEAAVQATSLDGTSFMSRIIRVCMKGSAQSETPSPSATAWPRAVHRGSTYPVPRFSRSPFPRGNPSSFRGRAIVRPGPRSLQWKRDAQPAPANTSDSAAAHSASTRSLTYVRPELKSEGNSA